MEAQRLFSSTCGDGPAMIREAEARGSLAMTRAACRQRTTLTSARGQRRKSRASKRESSAT